MDDFSTDGTYETLDQLDDEYPNLVVSRNAKNSGSLYTRLQLLKEAQGKYLLFLDCDDELSNPSLLAIAERNMMPADILSYRVTISNDSANTSRDF